MPEGQDKLTQLLKAKLEPLPYQKGVFVKLPRPVQNHKFSKNKTYDKSFVIFRAACRIYHWWFAIINRNKITSVIFLNWRVVIKMTPRIVAHFQSNSYTLTTCIILKLEYNKYNLTTG